MHHLEVSEVKRSGSILEVIGLMKSSELEPNTRSMKYDVGSSGAVTLGPMR